jgi:hypothetical protein
MLPVRSSGGMAGKKEFPREVSWKVVRDLSTHIRKFQLCKALPSEVTSANGHLVRFTFRQRQQYTVEKNIKRKISSDSNSLCV